MNICGCLVHAAPALAGTVRRTIEEMDGAEVHAEDDGGRLVVVVEDTPNAFASDHIMALHQIPGVISVTLTYHHFEDLSQPADRAAPPMPET